jgi:hypothetical protein
MHPSATKTDVPAGSQSPNAQLAPAAAAAPAQAGASGSLFAPATRVQASAADTAALSTPVFIVGSPRSGTSILINGLLAAGYKGFREGNFLTLLRVFENAINRHIEVFGQAGGQVMASRVDWPVFKRAMFEAFKSQVEALNPVSPWMDKTGNPEMIEAIPQILKLWPNAVFIFAKRRGIENIMSRLKKFPGHGFEYHCRDWARNMAAWRGARTLPGVRGIEIDQQEIIRAPNVVAAKLADFLGGGPGVRERIRATFVADRPQETEQGSALRVVDLEKNSWTAEQRDMFLKLCGTEMELFNYSLRGDYWASPNR